MKIYSYDILDSTNNEARRMIKAGAARDFCVLAGSQTGGRGQFGRSFFSPPTGLYFSVCLARGDKPGNSYITQAAAVAVCESVEGLFGVRLGIKPVNDIIYAGRKAGGILVESVAGLFEESGFAVFGIGLNLYRPEGGFPPEIRGIAGHIFEHEIDKMALVEEIIAGIEGYSSDFRSDAILGKYLERVVAHEYKG